MLLLHSCKSLFKVQGNGELYRRPRAGHLEVSFHAKRNDTRLKRFVVGFLIADLSHFFALRIHEQAILTATPLSTGLFHPLTL